MRARVIACGGGRGGGSGGCRWRSRACVLACLPMEVACVLACLPVEVARGEEGAAESRLRSEICVARRETTLFCVSFGLAGKMHRVIGSSVGADI
jgi:hypothetical protein